MTEIQRRLNSLRRPRLLVRAARLGLSDYARERDLKRMFVPKTPPGPGQAVQPLMDREAEIDAVRREGGAAYSAARHVEVLIALIAESRLAAEAIS
jgi:hypothetical protein